MNKQDVIAFFDERAAEWDRTLRHDDEVISAILDNAEVGRGCNVLDVGCGTGVLIPDYLSRQVGSVTAVDISPEMLRAAAAKFPHENVRFLCADAENAEFDREFDCIMIYNAFPHFEDPDGLIRSLSRFLKPGGTLSVAHGMSRAAIDAHHSGEAENVSHGLMHEDELAAIFERYLQLTVKISDERMYQVAGRRI